MLIAHLRNGPVMWINLFVLLLGGSLSLACLEIGLRLLPDAPGFSFRNFLTERLPAPLPKDPDWPHFVYDDKLGWTLNRNRPSDPQTSEFGIRLNGPTTRQWEKGQGILVVGDSVAYGHGVKDNETFPAYLEHKAKIPVANGAVQGYGIDQSYLRAERLVRQLNPSTLIFAYVPDDIRRSELSVYGSTPKPYFELREGELTLRNTPVPKNYTPSQKRAEWFQDSWGAVMGYSYTVFRITSLLGLSDAWIMKDREYIHAHKEGEAVSCLIMGKLKKFMTKYNTRVIVFAMHGSGDLLTETGYVGPPITTLLASGLRVQKCARDFGLETIDSFDTLRSYFADPKNFNDPAVEKLWLKNDPHHSPTGNEAMAAFLLNEAQLQ